MAIDAYLLGALLYVIVGSVFCVCSEHFAHKHAIFPLDTFGLQGSSIIIAAWPVFLAVVLGDVVASSWSRWRRRGRR